MSTIHKLLPKLSQPKRPKPHTYVAVRHERTISWYATEIITAEAVLIAIGAFLLASVVADHNRVYLATEALDGNVHKTVAITTYLACLFLMTGVVALRFYKYYKGLPVVLAVIAFLLAALGYVEFDNVLMNLPSVEYDVGA